MNRTVYKYMHSNRFIALFLMPVIFLLLTACQGQAVYRAYSGDPRPADKVAMLTVPAEFNLLYIDGEKYSSLSDGARLELLPGKHQLVIEYDVFWDITSDVYDRVVSQPVMLSFESLPGRRYNLTFKLLKELKNAKAYAKKPDVEIVDLVSRQNVEVAHKYKLTDKGYVAAFVADNPMVGKNDKGNVPKMLEYWWQQADYQQQQSFLDWSRSHAKRASGE